MFQALEKGLCPGKELFGVVDFIVGKATLKEILGSLYKVEPLFNIVQKVDVAIGVGLVYK